MNSVAPLAPSRGLHRGLSALLLAAAVGGALGALRPAAGASELDDGASAYRLLAWDSSNGLPQNSVRAIAQTRDGYLWVGTREGLARFNGFDFTVFNPDNTPELPDAAISALLGAPDGSLWIGTDTGGLLRMEAGRFRRCEEAEVPRQRIHALAAAPDGSTWVAHSGGVEHWQDGRVVSYARGHGLRRAAMRALAVDGAGTAWIGLANGVHAIRDGQVAPAIDERSRMGAIRTIHVQRSGARWTACSSEVIREQAGEITRYRSSAGIEPRLVLCLFEDSGATLWLGTSEGLYRFEGNRFVRETAKGRLVGDAIHAIREDREGSLWLATNDGLKQLRRTAFSSYTTLEGLPHNLVTSVCEDHAGALWIGTFGGGLVRWRGDDRRRFTSSDGLASTRVLAMLPARDGGLWVSTDSSRFNRIVEDRVIDYARPSGSQWHAAALLEDTGGTLWLGAGGGLARLAGQAVVKHGGAGADIRALAEDASGALWLGTEAGVARFVDGKPAPLAVLSPLERTGIRALRFDAKGTLWIGTEGRGLWWLERGKLIACTAKDGLFNDTILEIVDDDLGHLWLTSRQGIFRVARAALARHAADPTRRIECQVFGKEHGMTAIEGGSLAKPAAWKGRDGRLWFASVKGLLVTDPARLPANLLPPPAVVTRLEVDQRPIPLPGDGRGPTDRAPALRLPPGRGHVKVHFAALSFAEPDRLHFKYRLEGVDVGWVDAGAQRTAIYNGVPPGVRRFEVMARNNDGVWSTAPASITFELAPRFHQTWWFYGLVVAGVGGGAYGIHRLRLRSLRRRHEELEALVRERTHALSRVQSDLLEASRQAGMAEVATGVLHNVGNVLNSVNVSATVLAEQVRRSRLDNLGKLGALLAEHESDLGRFLTHDPRGQKVPAFLRTLSTHLEGERQETLRELQSLRTNVEHIKEIVAMQQSYARVSGVSELVPITELVEDALRINASGFTRHDVAIVRDFRDNPTLLVEKHKVLQILVNLMRNAKYACDESGRPDKRMIVRVGREAEKLSIAIIDNGVGIAPENLTRIFAHGFTTRRDGHGFGLHSGAIAAKELGGSLVAQSEGLGCGATFVLQLPLEKEVKAA